MMDLIQRHRKLPDLRSVSAILRSGDGLSLESINQAAAHKIIKGDKSSGLAQVKG